MRSFLKKILWRPVIWATGKFSSRPERQKVFESLDKLYSDIVADPGDKGLLMPFRLDDGRFVIFSDQHKGARNGADDFSLSESNYLSALDYYDKQGYFFISLGDSEELWENNLSQVKKFNQATFQAEKRFREENRFIKVFGNHDLYWDNDPLASFQLKSIYGGDITIYEGVILTTLVEGRPLRIFCAHGHQGDARSDGNWFSKFFVSTIWAPLQAWLRINPNTPAYDTEKKTLHNHIMYEWSLQKSDTLLITGHTHQPVFMSLTHLERLYRDFQRASAKKDEQAMERLATEIRRREREFNAVSTDYMEMKPGYFNSGCCCYSDGDITGIEIAGGEIRLVKWKKAADGSARQLLESISLAQLCGLIRG